MPAASRRCAIWDRQQLRVMLLDAARRARCNNNCCWRVAERALPCAAAKQQKMHMYDQPTSSCADVPGLLCARCRAEVASGEPLRQHANEARAVDATGVPPPSLSFNDIGTGFRSWWRTSATRSKSAASGPRLLRSLAMRTAAPTTVRPLRETEP
jgi:hypothetical protein